MIRKKYRVITLVESLVELLWLKKRKEKKYLNQKTTARVYREGEKTKHKTKKDKKKINLGCV